MDNISEMPIEKILTLIHSLEEEDRVTYEKNPDATLGDTNWIILQEAYEELILRGVMSEDDLEGDDEEEDEEDYQD